MQSRFTLTISPETHSQARVAAPALYRSGDLPGLDPRAKEIIRATANELLDLPATTVAPFSVVIELDGDNEDPGDIARYFAAAGGIASVAGDDAMIDILRAAETASIALMERRG